MMIESMAGKAGALHGMPFDATPFTFSENQSAIDFFGQTLTAGENSFALTTQLDNINCLFVVLIDPPKNKKERLHSPLHGTVTIWW